MTQDADSRNGIYIVLAVLVLAIIVGVIFYFTDSGEEPEQKEVQKAEVPKEQKQEEEPEVEDEITKVKKSLKTTEKAFIQMAPEGYDSMRIQSTYEKLYFAVDSMQINVSKFKLLPGNFEAAFEDNELTADEADLLLNLLESAVVQNDKDTIDESDNSINEETGQ
ncbi:MAG: hypothetical protein ACLFSQ_07940 [Candidatus Zixiibacteriota bacterium]